MQTVTLAPHEFVANLLFNEDGLAPFFGLDSAVKQAGGSRSEEFHADGEQWVARLSYQESNIVHPGQRTPLGTPFEIETIREYRIKIMRHPSEDPVGKQDFTAHIAPRWPGMQGEKEDGTRVEIAVPDGFGQGVNVRVKGSNVAFDRYPKLLRRAAGVLGIATRYFEEPHEFSNIQDAERYARVHRDASGPVHARDGPLASMGYLLEHDRSGYRKVVQDDDDVHGQTLPGFYHTTTLDATRIREAFPDHAYPKEVKHYYAKEAKDRDPDDPLAHPKVGASLQVSLLDQDETVRWADRESLRRELDQTVLSVLADAGLDVAPGEGSGPFVPDAYWNPEVDHSGPAPVGLDLTRIEQSQESVVIRHLADGLSPVQWEALETLVTDGGEIAPADIAAEHDRHVGSVRRALRDMEDLVRREYAEVALSSEYVAEMVHEAVREARESVQRAVETSAKAVEAAERGLDETMSSFLAWAARHGVDVDGAREARLKLRFNTTTMSDVQAAVTEGLLRWKRAGLDEQEYREAQIRLSDGSLSEAWRWIDGTVPTDW